MRVQACEQMDTLKKNLRQEHVLIHDFLSTFYTQVYPVSSNTAVFHEARLNSREGACCEAARHAFFYGWQHTVSADVILGTHADVAAGWQQITLRTSSPTCYSSILNAAW